MIVMQTILSLATPRSGNSDAALITMNPATDHNHEGWEAFLDAISPSNSCWPPADWSSDCVVLHRNRMRRAAIIVQVCSILFISILESRRRRDRLYITRELLAPPGSGAVWDQLRAVQDKQNDAFLLIMGISVHSFEYLNNGFSEQWNRAIIDRNGVNSSSGATGGHSRPEWHSLYAAGTLSMLLALSLFCTK